MPEQRYPGKSPDLDERYVTIAEVAKALRVSHDTINRAVRDGNLPGAFQLTPNTIRIPESAVYAFIEGMPV